MQEFRNHEFRKLHILIPEELFQTIRTKGVLGQIDSVVIELLKDYFIRETFGEE